MEKRNNMILLLLTSMLLAFLVGCAQDGTKLTEVVAQSDSPQGSGKYPKIDDFQNKLDYNSSTSFKRSNEDNSESKPSEIVKFNQKDIKDIAQKKEVTYESGLFVTTLNTKNEDEKIMFSFSLKNTSLKDQQLSFGSGQKYDIYVFNDQEEIYSWAHDKSFTSAIIDINLSKEDSLTFTEVWDLRDNDGNSVPKGHYSITVKILATIKIENKQIMVNPDELMNKSVIEIK